MSRIPDIEYRAASWRVRAIFWLIQRKTGIISPGSKIRAHWPKWLVRSGRVDALMAARGTIADSLKELAQLKTAALIGCPY